MNDPKKAKKWLERAKSNLALANIGKASDYIVYEDLCFDAQQAVEKGLKALCIFNGIVFPKTHDISFIISLLEHSQIHIPDFVKEAKILTDYSVETRYPGDFEPVTEEEYSSVIKIANDTLLWIEKIIIAD